MPIPPLPQDSSYPGRRRAVRVLPVIHHRDDALSIEQAELAFELGADGVFLIEMDRSHWRPEAAAAAIRERHPGRPVGMNRLGLSPAEAILRDASIGLDMTWTDASGLNSDPAYRWSDDRILEVSRALDQARTGREHDLFFAVAFKYQARDPDPPRTAREAASLGWIPTTSGAGTGIAAEPEHLEAMRHALGEAPLAIASGITPENASSYLGTVTHILVSTGISYPDDEYRFDPSRVRSLLRAVRGA